MRSKTGGGNGLGTRLVVYLRFFSKAARQNPERKAWVRGYSGGEAACPRYQVAAKMA